MKTLLLIFQIVLAFPLTGYCEVYMKSFATSTWVNCIADGGDYIWCGTQKNVIKVRKSDNSITRYGISEGLPYPDVSSIKIDKDGLVWAVTNNVNDNSSRDAYISNFDGTKWSIFCSQGKCDILAVFCGFEIRSLVRPAQVGQKFLFQSLRPLLQQ